MAVGLNKLPKLHLVNGVQLGVSQAGIKYPDRYDLTVIGICEGARVAAVFTQNQFCAAPVVVAKRHFSKSTVRYLVINTGNANAGNGEQGLEDAINTCKALASLTRVPPQAVLPFSTGVIGEKLPVERLISALPKVVDNLDEDNWALAAEAIMTTDTVPKGCSQTFQCAGVPVVITGIAKGSGMICPNMATLLSFIATDADIDQPLLQEVLARVNRQSFNSITVDSDTSTNDACVLIATGKGPLLINQDTEQSVVDCFVEQLLAVMQQLAQSLIRDAEGASKFIAVNVRKAASEQEARQIAYTVAHSPLVKTAFFASDPNWGRILAAIGRAGVEDLNVNALTIFLNDVCIVENGARAKSYSELKGQAVMDQQDIEIIIDLARGEVSQTIWTSDLSHDYVKINAEYRT